MVFKSRYFIVTVLLLLIEILIGAYVHDAIIRPYVGDILVVILIYTFIKSFFLISFKNAAISVLIFSFVIEISQKFNLAKHLHLENNKLAVTIIGNSFSWIDMICYVLGFIIILVVEKFGLIHKLTKQPN